MSTKRLFLVDGMSNIFRAYYAIRGLSNSRGMPTNAIYGFTTMLKKLITDEKPDYLAVVFDTAEPTFRHKIYADYKANRSEMPDDLSIQIPYVYKVCEALRVPTLRMPGYEADDVIGTFALKAAKEGIEVVIVSSDKDLCQLVGKNVKILRADRQGYTYYDERGVEERLGVKPNQVIDLLALWGDSSDNIPGAPGIGEKGATQIIRQFGTVEQALENWDKVEKKTYRQSLRDNRELILKSRELVTIKTDVPLETELNELEYQGPDPELAFELFNELDFSTLLKDISEATKGQAKQAEAAAVEVEPAGRYHLITSEKEADLALKQLWQQDRFAFRAALENGDVIGFALSTEPHTASYIDLVATHKSIVDFKEVFENGLVAKCAHDFKPAMKALRRQGISVEGAAADAMIAAWLIEPNKGKYDLRTVAREHLKIEWEDDLPDGERLAREADVILRLCDQLDERIKQMGLESVYRQIELPLIELLAEMELVGVKINADDLKQTAEEIDVELEGLVEKVYQAAGRQFNINSPQQVGEVFEAVGIAVTKRTKKTGQISTSADVLDELATKHELPRLILDYRELVKLKGTYVEALPKLIDPATGRIHTTFNQTGTATGRLSSSSPNLQNIPVRTEFGRRIRQAFIAEPGWMLLCADYSQIELRILAHITGDKAMTEAFQHGMDIHAHVARTVFGAKTPDEERDQRRLAKIVNFGIAYSIGAFGLAQRIGLPRREAQRVIDNYYKTYSGVRHYMQETPKQARQTGYVRTLFGRIRPIPDIANKNHNLRARAEREAINAPIQGCLPYHTRVLTSAGYIPIGELYEAKRDDLSVWTGTSFASFKVLHRGACELAELELENKHILSCDTRHQVLAVTEEGYCWKNYQQLKVGDRICLTLPQEIEFGSKPKFKYEYRPRANNGKPLKIEALDEQFFYWLGFYCGDSSIHHKPEDYRWSLSYCIGSKSRSFTMEEKARECVEYFKRYGLNPRTRFPTEHKVVVAISSRGLVEFLDQLGVETRATAATKRIPEFIFGSPLRSRKAFLRGLLDADGYDGGNGATNPTLHLCQRQILEDAWLLFRTVGVEAKIRGPYSYRGHISYRLDLVGAMLERSLGVSGRSIITIRDVAAPGFLVEAFLTAVSPAQLGRHSHQVIYSRLRHGGTTSVYTLAEMARASGVRLPVPIFAWSRLRAKRRLGTVESTFTLAVDDPLHCFDSEGVISKNTAADIVKFAMIRVDQALKKKGLKGRMLLQVHDELVLEVPESEVDETSRIVKSEMENACQLNVPLVVDVGVGRNWLEAKGE